MNTLLSFLLLAYHILMKIFNIRHVFRDAYLLVSMIPGTFRHLVIGGVTFGWLEALLPAPYGVLPHWPTLLHRVLFVKNPHDELDPKLEHFWVYDVVRMIFGKLKHPYHCVQTSGKHTYDFAGELVGTTVKKPRFRTQHWFFVNGMLTPAAMCIKNGRRIEQLFGQPVKLVFNETYGTIIDTVEICLARWFHISHYGPADRLFRQVSKQLEHDRPLAEKSTNKDDFKIVLIAHSEGTIIVRNVLLRLKSHYANDPFMQVHITNYLEVYMFAPAVDFLTKVADEHIELFVNEGDAICLFSVLNPKLKKKISFTRSFHYKRQGHLLNMHYLESFKYDNEGKDSLLHSYLK